MFMAFSHADHPLLQPLRGWAARHRLPFPLPLAGDGFAELFGQLGEHALDVLGADGVLLGKERREEQPGAKRVDAPGDTPVCA
jgi:hypothetical protein